MADPFLNGSGSPLSGGGSYLDSFNSALDSASSLSSSPGLALDAANSDDPSRSGIVLAQTNNVASAADAANNEQQDGGGGGGVLHWLAGVGHHINNAIKDIPGGAAAEHGVGTVVDYLSKPIQDLQDDYAYLHKVWTDHGPIAGFLATLGVAGGATAGFFLTGDPMLGADAALAGERHLAKAGAFGDSYKQTAIDAQTAKISPGRDLSNLLGQVPGLHTLRNTDSGVGKFVSGAGDFGTMMASDPVALASKFKSGLKTGDTLAKINAPARFAVMDKLQQARQATVGDFYATHFPGLRTTTPDALDNLVTKGTDGTLQRTNGPVTSALNGANSYHRALGEIAASDATDIANKYPALQSLIPNTYDAAGHVIFKGLADANTPGDVHDVFRNVVANQEFASRLTNMSVLPSKALTRVPFSAVADKLRTADGDTGVADQSSLILPKRVGTSLDDNSLNPVTGQGVIGGAVNAVKNIPAIAKDTLSPSNWQAGALGPSTLLRSLAIGTDTGADARSEIAGAVAKKVRTFSGYMPFVMDPKTRALSTTTFNPNSENAIQGVYRTMRFSMGDTRARYWTNQFVNAPNESTRQAIWREGLTEMYKAAGLPDDHFLVDNLRQKIDQATSVPMTEPKEVYGVGLEKGTDVSRVTTPNGTDASALFTHQAGDYSFPNFFALHREMRALQGAVKTGAGNVNDFLADTLINRWFKPMALLNAGFGARVALAEAIPAASRYGAMNMLRDGVLGAAAEKGYKLDPGEEDHIAATTASMMGGVSKLLGATDEERKLANTMTIQNQGHIVTGLARTGEENGNVYMLPGDQGEKMKALAYFTRSEYKNDPRYRGMFKVDHNFDTIHTDNNLYNEEWLTRLGQYANEEPVNLIAQDLIDAHDAQGSLNDVVSAEADRIRAAANGDRTALAPYTFEKNLLKRYQYIDDGTHTPEDFAFDRVDAIRGLLTGQDDTFHYNLAQKLANGEKVSMDELEAIPKESRPIAIYGPDRLPYVSKNIGQQITQWGFKKVVDPIINNVSRRPLYFNAVKTEMRSLQHFVDDGSMDYDTAVRLAQTRGAAAVLPQIHNVALRSQFAQLTRLFLPFYFAQEQAVKRLGYAAAIHPEVLRRQELIQHSLNEPGFIGGDNSSGKYLVYPLVGSLGSLATDGISKFSGGRVPIIGGLPMTVSGNMMSLQSVFPEMHAPGVSPMVSIPANLIASLFPETKWVQDATKTALGPVAYEQGVMDSLIPNTFLRNMFMAMHPDDRNRSYGNALLGAMAEAMDKGEVPAADAPAADKRKFLNKIQMNTRFGFALKAILGAVMPSPLAPEVANENPGLPSEFQNLIKAHNGDYLAARDQFLQEHGPGALAYTLSKSHAATTGATTPYTDDVMNFVDGNRDLLNGPNATGAAFLMPQNPGKGDVGLIHDELINQGLRIRDTPEDFLKAWYLAQGDLAYEADHKVHQDFMDANAGDTQLLDAENKNWSDHVTQLGLKNPEWWDDFQSQDRKHNAELAYTQLLNIFNTKANPDLAQRMASTDQGQAVLGLLNDYQNHLIQMASIGNGRTQAATDARTQERNDWSKYLNDKKDANPALRSVITSVFSRLDDSQRV